MSAYTEILKNKKIAEKKTGNPAYVQGPPIGAKKDGKKFGKKSKGKTKAEKK